MASLQQQSQLDCSTYEYYEYWEKEWRKWGESWTRLHFEYLERLRVYTNSVDSSAYTPLRFAPIPRESHNEYDDTVSHPRNNVLGSTRAMDKTTSIAFSIQTTNMDQLYSITKLKSLIDSLLAYVGLQKRERDPYIHSDQSGYAIVTVLEQEGHMILYSIPELHEIRLFVHSPRFVSAAMIYNHLKDTNQCFKSITYRVMMFD